MKSCRPHIRFAIRQRQFRIGEYATMPAHGMEMQASASGNEPCKCLGQVTPLTKDMQFRAAGQQQLRLPGGPIRSARQHYALALKPPENRQLGEFLHTGRFIPLRF
ncbi:UNVERIFIED_ORG: hypothetical protein QE448_000908 [Rhizobium sp. SORGH_AS285]|nr:hypothetical protein [Rhizobium sp. SORGH_AS_0285]